MSEQNKNFEELVLFKTSVFVKSGMEFLDLVKKVSLKPEHHVKKDDSKKADMSKSFHLDEELSTFSSFVVQSAWEILQYQGYAMNSYNTYFESMWMQDHEHDSFMAQHVHSSPIQVVGFYFTEVPEGGSKLLLHDPRPAKVQSDLYEEDSNKATNASRIIMLTPRVGDLIFTPAWLSHSFTQNKSNDQFKFVHINIATTPAQQTCEAPVIV